jgi:hypothetical protein
MLILYQPFSISAFFASQSFRSIWPIFCFTFTYIYRLIFWSKCYLQLHFVCDKLPLSDMPPLICYGWQTLTHCIRGGILHLNFFLNRLSLRLFCANANKRIRQSVRGRFADKLSDYYIYPIGPASITSLGILVYWLKFSLNCSASSFAVFS